MVDRLARLPLAQLGADERLDLDRGDGVEGAAAEEGDQVDAECPS